MANNEDVIQNSENIEAVDEQAEKAHEEQEETFEQVRERLTHTEKALAEVREEAAARRIKNKELSEALEGAKTEEDIQAAVAEWRTQVETLERDILVRDVADEFGLPPALRDRLRGADRDELVKDAKALQELLSASSGRERVVNEEGGVGGLDPMEGHDDTDISAVVKRAIRGR